MEPNRGKCLPFTFDLEKEIELLFSELVDEPWGKQVIKGNWQPEVDLYEDSDSYLIDIDLPGVSAEQVSVRIENQTVTISGSREIASVARSAQRIRLERRHGSFVRRLPLPSPVDGERMEQWCSEGTLHIRLPKSENKNV